MRGRWPFSGSVREKPSGMRNVMRGIRDEEPALIANNPADKLRGRKLRTGAITLH